MNNHYNKAENIMELLPYIKKYKGKTFVIKYGGSAMIKEDIKRAVLQDLVLLNLMGINIILVHGGGPAINSALKESNIEPKFINGLRVTDIETMKTVERVLCELNKQIADEISFNGVQAKPVCADGVLTAHKKLSDGIDLGYVGEVTVVDIKTLYNLLAQSIIPIIAPIGKDKESNSYNINADYAAVAVAAAIKAEKLCFLTDTEGVLKDQSDITSVISRLSIKDIQEYISNGTITSGMIPKVQSCMRGITEGITSIHILDGRIKHSIISNIFALDNNGTTIEE